MAVEKVVIIGSGPAAWSAAIYASRAELQPLVFEGAINEQNRLDGTLPLGQLNLTTEVENYAGFPAGNLAAYLDDAIDPQVRQIMAPHSGHGVSGPELMELMRQQAKNFGTRIVTDDIAKVDFSTHPFKLFAAAGETVEAHTVIVATGARANYLGLPRSRSTKTAASAPAPSATAPCRAFATSRWSWWAVATRPSKRPHISANLPAKYTSYTGAMNCGRRRSWPSGPNATRRSTSPGTTN